jgi:hypothetical protein
VYFLLYDLAGLVKKLSVKNNSCAREGWSLCARMQLEAGEVEFARRAIEESFA